MSILSPTVWMECVTFIRHFQEANFYVFHQYRTFVFDFFSALITCAQCLLTKESLFLFDIRALWIHDKYWAINVLVGCHYKYLVLKRRSVYLEKWTYRRLIPFPTFLSCLFQSAVLLHREEGFLQETKTGLHHTKEPSWNKNTKDN